MAEPPLHRILLGATNGLVKEMKTFDIEGHVGIDVQKPSTVNPQSFVWVTACTKKVQNCSLAAARKLCQIDPAVVCLPALLGGTRRQW